MMLIVSRVIATDIKCDVAISPVIDATARFHRATKHEVQGEFVSARQE